MDGWEPLPPVVFILEELDLPPELEPESYEVTLRAPAEFTDLEQIRNTVIERRDGALVTLGQVARVRDTYEKALEALPDLWPAANNLAYLIDAGQINIGIAADTPRGTMKVREARLMATWWAAISMVRSSASVGARGRR